MKEQFLKEKLKRQYQEVNNILESFTVDRYTTFRINTLKGEIEPIVNHLQNLGFQLEKVPYVSYAFVSLNKKEEDFYQLEEYQNGQIYLQSLSSMLPVFFLDVKPKESILDMTAAPGSKTTQMASVANNLCSITACEKNPIRAKKLKYNLEKQGVKCCTVLECDTRKLDSYFRFDKILLDAPCTGSGTIHQKEIEQNPMLTKENLEKISHTQKELLEKAVSLLKPKGVLVYSTCSIFEEENENIIEYALTKLNCEIIPISLEEVPYLKTKIDGTLCIKPSKYYEGFFIAKLKKKE